MYQLGKFKLTSVSDGQFKLDGGAMFGVVPKVFWEKIMPADEMNRISMGLNPLLIQKEDENILIETGIGDKYTEKLINIYCITHPPTLTKSLKTIGVEVEDITKVILTHLHFDHCGGNTRYSEDGAVIPTFPNAKYYVQKTEWEVAIDPNERTKSSYLSENLLPLKEHGQLIQIDGDEEISDGVNTIVTGGHTEMHQSVLIESEGQKAIYWGDLIPTTAHIKIPYIMSYDLYPLNTLEMKKNLIAQALEENWLCIFEHDPNIKMGFLKEGEDETVIEKVC